MILIFGDIRCLKFTELTDQDVENTGNQCSLKDIKTIYPRSFVIGAQYYILVNIYVALRMTGIDTNNQSAKNNCWIS